MPNTEQELNEWTGHGARAARLHAARVAFYGTLGNDMDNVMSAVENCVQSATQVAITPELIEAVTGQIGPLWNHEGEHILRVVLEAAGFEVKP